MTSPLWVYVNVGQLKTPPFQSVYWKTYNSPDSTGQYSGYFGQLQNIAVASSQQVTYPSNNTPTLDANSLNGTPIANTAPANGQVLVFDSTSNTYVPGGTTGGGGQFNVTLANGLNSNIATGGLQTMRVGGPTGAFSIGGFAAGAAGSSILLTNTTSQRMTILNNDASSTAANRIDTQSNGSQITLLPKAGAVLFLYDNVENRWVLQNVGIHRPNRYNVRDFGAIGDYTTDDTAAVSAAAAAFQAAVLANGYPTLQGAGYSLYFPAGSYTIATPEIITGITGGVIEGDGIGVSILYTTTSAAMAGAAAPLILKNCQHVTVRDLDIRPSTVPMQLTGGGLMAGGTSFTVNFVTHVSAGQLVGLVTANGKSAEMASVVSVVGTTITIARGSLYAYAANDYLIAGPLSAFACVNDGTLSPASHANKFQRVSFNGPSSHGCLFGFLAICRGGGPVSTVGTNSSGQPVLNVTDATQIVDGDTYLIYSNVVALLDTLTVQSHNVLTGAVTFTTNLTHTYSAGSYLVSSSDANNDEHVFQHCVANNCVVAAAGIVGWNSLNHSFSDTESSGCYAIVSARQGGSVKWVGGDASGLGCSYEFGGGQQQPQIVDKTESEGGTAQLFVSHSVDNTQGLTLWASKVVTKSHPLSGNLVDLTSTSLAVTFDACWLAPGLSGGNSIGLNFVDGAGAGVVVLHGDNQIGPDAVGLNGVTLLDVDSTWTSPAVFGQSPTETLSNGGIVRAIAPTYGGRNGTGGGSIERRPIAAKTFVNGDNDSVNLVGDADLLITGPTGAYALKGFATKNVGQRLRIKFNVNQQLTIKNNSSSSVPILTPTGADIVIAAAGAFVIRDFWCDGTSWNLVQGGTGP